MILIVDDLPDFGSESVSIEISSDSFFPNVSVCRSHPHCTDDTRSRQSTNDCPYGQGTNVFPSRPFPANRLQAGLPMCELKWPYVVFTSVLIIHWGIDSKLVLAVK